VLLQGPGTLQALHLRRLACQGSAQGRSPGTSWAGLGRGTQAGLPVGPEAGQTLVYQGRSPEAGKGCSCSSQLRKGSAVGVVGKRVLSRRMRFCSPS